MLFHKKASKPAQKTLKLPLKFDFGTTAEDVRNSFNVERTANGIKTRYRRDIQVFPAIARYIVGYVDDYVYFMTDGGLCRMSEKDKTVFMEGLDWNVSSCVYRGNLIVSGKDYGTYVVKECEATKVYHGGFSSITSCADRLFGLYKNQITYTAAGKVDGWEQGQTISLPGECQAVVSIGDKVYALGDDCYALIPKADDIEFKVVRLARNVGVVAPRSVVSYYDSLIFGTESGLYQLRSDKISPICEQLNEVLLFGVSAGVIFKGKYCLTCASKDVPELYNNVTVCIDVEREEIVGMLRNGGLSIAKTSKNVIMSGIGSCYVFYDGFYDGKYRVSNVDFGTNDKKFLDKLVLKTATDIDVTIRSETETRLYKLKGKSYPQNLFLRDMGWRFSIEFFSEDGLDVQNAVLYAHTSKEA